MDTAKLKKTCLESNARGVRATSKVREWCEGAKGACKLVEYLTGPAWVFFLIQPSA